METENGESENLQEHDGNDMRQSDYDGGFLEY